MCHQMSQGGGESANVSRYIFSIFTAIFLRLGLF